MAKPQVYVETTIPSFFYSKRTDPETLARRQWTRQWWSEAPGRYDLVTSIPVLDELEAGHSDQRSDRLALLAQLEILPLEPAVLEIAQAYIFNKVMPADPGGDALHLALASYYKCDFLVTWNCRHLANANKFGHIRRVNSLLGLFVPTLVTPLELIGDSDGPNSP